jgi:hypothetical protein
MKEVLESVWNTRNTTWTALLNFLSPSVDNLMDAVSKYSIRVEDVSLFAANQSRLITLKDIIKVNNFLLEAQKIEVWQLESNIDFDFIFRTTQEYLREE